jgi:hypothetical protein
MFGQTWPDVFQIFKRKSVNKNQTGKPWRQAASNECKNETKSRGKKAKKKEWIY